jgi:hypothetical protein
MKNDFLAGFRSGSTLRCLSNLLLAFIERAVFCRFWTLGIVELKW